MILIEGKKEEVSKMLKQKFEYDKAFIDRILSLDPTGYKYIDYIANQLEKIIPKLAGDRGGLNITQQDAIEDRMGIIIPWFNNNVDKISEDDIWNAETAYRQSYGLVPNIEGIAKNPKDIFQYENPEFIRTLMFFVDSKKTEREKERELKSQVEKIYEDDSVLVVRPKSHAASCYYGANTKWCTTTTGSPKYFEHHSKGGFLYYFINKKENIKMALYKDSLTNKSEVWDSKDNPSNIRDLKELFPNQDELIDDLTGNVNFIKALKKFSRGYITARDLEDSDNSIVKVKTYNPLGQSIVVLGFKNDDEFFKSLNLGDNDIWFMHSVFYNDYQFVDYSTAESDFKDGYVIYEELTNSNLEKLGSIADIIYPNEKFDLSNEEYRIGLTNVLIDLFESDIDYIINSYVDECNDSATENAQKQIRKEIDDYLESMGFSVYNEYDEISSTVINLMMKSAILNIPTTDLKSLFNQIVEKNNMNLGYWAENSYEYDDKRYFNTELFNDVVERKFNDILESLENSAEEEGNPISKFIEFRNRIINKFDLKKWYTLPKDNEIKFNITGFDREELKVLVTIQNLKKGYNRLSLSEENFYNFLYQPQLFDLFGT